MKSRGHGKNLRRGYWLNGETEPTKKTTPNKHKKKTTTKNPPPTPPQKQKKKTQKTKNQHKKRTTRTADNIGKKREKLAGRRTTQRGQLCFSMG